ncbi:zinc metallopeptidase [Blattabacterium cuenoti]|uniref:zinc metallopeptidase n=1 Tax=Blattabacterium cuenoti TaxID=1653831 RepID=UPI00163C5E15|nr:zinc metallopeptidase [Blattabacterium cuenoti]
MNYYYWIVTIIFLVSFFVSRILKRKIRFYSGFQMNIQMTGKEIAEKMLYDSGIHDVDVLFVEGELTDYYDPLNKTINLSENVYSKKTVSAIAVSAHECGHALQHKLGYGILKFRNQIEPLLNLSSKLTNITIMFGLSIFYSSEGKNSFFLKLGIGLFFLAVIFSFITLPIEFDASKRALIWLKDKKIVNHKEYNQARDSLNWAAMTYVVSALGSFSQLIYFISFLNTTPTTSSRSNENQIDEYE